MEDQQCKNLGMSPSNGDDRLKMDSTIPLQHLQTIPRQDLESSHLMGETATSGSASDLDMSRESCSAKQRAPAVPKSLKEDSANPNPLGQSTVGTASEVSAKDLSRSGFGAPRKTHHTLSPMTLVNQHRTMENDTRDDDTVLRRRHPLHTSSEVSWKKEVSTLAYHSAEEEKMTSSVSLKPRLTLSAFRRPSVRIADPDTSRKISDEYELGTVLGHGGSSTVRLAHRRSDGIPVAVKSIAKHEALRYRRRSRHLDEWKLLESLRGHQHVVSLLDVFETDEEIQLIMEYCEGGELFDVIQRNKNEVRADRRYSYSETKAKRIVAQILSVLVDLHARHIVHRDVKPENILLTNDGVDVCAKLSDFGTSRELHPEEECCSSDGESSPLTPPNRKRAYSAVGSNFYAAPEVNAGEGYGTSIDVYSLGVTLYVLLCGFPPSFTTVDDDDHVNFPISSWSNVSHEAKLLIRKMLDPEPSRRITAKEALQDAWIVQNSPPPVDMELVRSRLFSGLDSDEDESDDDDRLSKRRKVLADLYEGVASAAASAAAAAAGVLCNDEDVCVEDDEEEDERVTSPFESSFTALSV